MIYDKLKKVVISAAIAAAFILSIGFANSSATLAQYRDRDRWGDHDRRWDDRRDREEMARIRRLDWQRQLRYRWNSSIRVVGYHDRFGRFHAYGFYDRFGRFHRY